MKGIQHTANTILPQLLSGPEHKRVVVLHSILSRSKETYRLCTLGPYPPMELPWNKNYLETLKSP